MGNPFAHMELSTGDVAAAKKFYKKVFDWKLVQLGADMGHYTLIDVGSKTVGGGIAGKMSPKQPTAWTPYASVDSVKKTIARAVKAGAKAVVPFQEIGDMGAVGVFVDPTGATFGVWEAARKKPAKKQKGAKAAKKLAEKAARKAEKQGGKKK